MNQLTLISAAKRITSCFKQHCLLILPLFFLVGCHTGPGPGGKSSIRGKVCEHKYNYNFSYLFGSYDASDHDVYIIYGDDLVYGEKFSTHHDGTFEFNYLLPGTYTVFCYSKDSSNTSLTDVVVDTTFEISGRKEVIDLGTLHVYDN